MPTYQYRCRDCRAIIEKFFAMDDPLRDWSPQCPHCGSKHTVKKFSFTIGEIFQPHFNDAVGREVTSRHDLQSALSEASDKASLRTGNTHNFKTVDIRDTPPEALGVGEEGMRETHDRAVAEGRIDPTPKTIL